MYYCQQQIIATWTTMSSHTVRADVVYQMNPIYGSMVRQLNSMRVIDAQGTVYASKVYMVSVIILLAFPTVAAIDSLLRVW